MTTTHESTASAPAPQQPVVIERTYRASPEEIWALWTTKDGFESWWGPVGFRVEVQAIEARVGGPLHYDMIADAPEMVAAMKQMGRPLSHQTHGTFSELRPHDRLTLTHIIDFLPGVAPYETTIAVELIPRGDTVRMVVTLSPHLDETFTRMSIEGFTSQLTKLDGRFGAARA